MMRYVSRYVRNVCILMFSTLGITYLYRAYIRRAGPLVRVIVFHDVRDRVWFERIILHLKTQYHVLTPEQFFARSFHETKINILITFDDGYASWATVCAPIFEAHGMRALFFINTGILYVSQNETLTHAFVRDNLQLTTTRTLLTPEQCTLLIAQGHTIGGHTTHHKRLVSLDDATQQQEVGDDKNALEQYTHESISAFAYPFGRRSDFTERSIDVVKRAGYKYAFTTESAFVPARGNPYTIPRTCIEDGISLSHFDRWMKGGYDIFVFIKSFLA